MNNLELIGLAMHNYHETHRGFPPRGIYDEHRTGYQSWQYSLLNYVGQERLFRQIDPDEPWDGPRNAPHYQAQVPAYRNPAIDADFTAAGFAVSHYALNERTLLPNRSVRTRDFTDGLANTILAGEVAAGFKAWGDPANARDPANGIRHDANTFGRSMVARGCYLLIADGSVRFISDAVDPDVLQALATPRGGEILKKDPAGNMIVMLPDDAVQPRGTMIEFTGANDAVSVYSVDFGTVPLGGGEPATFYVTNVSRSDLILQAVSPPDGFTTTANFRDNLVVKPTAYATLILRPLTTERGVFEGDAKVRGTCSEGTWEYRLRLKCRVK